MATTSDDNTFCETNRYRCLYRTVKLTEEIYPISCGVERCWKNKLVNLSGRPGYHLHTVLKGNGSLIVNDVLNEVQSGQFFLLKPGERVIYQADDEDPWIYCWIAFDGKKASEFMNLAGFTDGINVVDNNLDSDIFLHLVQKMLDHPEMNYSSDLMRMGIMTEYIAKTIESYNKGIRENRKYRSCSKERYVEYAVSLIESNYGKLQVDDIAKTIGIHRSYLTSIFKQQTGVSPQSYLLNFRIRKACSLLRETDLTIKEIAGLVGYENTLTFSKLFKSYKGVSPRTYRNEEQEGENIE